MKNNDSELIKKKCKPCEGGIHPLTMADIEKYMKQVNEGWEVVDNKRINKNYAFVNYKHTIDFVNKVANLSEEEGHHPVMHIYYGKVQLEIWTHAINGLSENDFILAAKINTLL
jgi:4a-hydroxytetrahydrobiopterin dehydratase